MEQQTGESNNQSNTDLSSPPLLSSTSQGVNKKKLAVLAGAVLVLPAVLFVVTQQTRLNSRANTSPVTPVTPLATVAVATQTPEPTLVILPTNTLVPMVTVVPTTIPSPTIIPTATPTPLVKTVTYHITNGAGDVNEDSGTYDPSSKTVWMGAGQTVNTSYTGLRFMNVRIPKGATIVSAKLEVYPASNQWLQVAFLIAAEKGGNSLAFTDTSRPSQRLLTDQKVQHSSNMQWNQGQKKTLNNIAVVVQEVVSQPNWNSGQALAIILKGTTQPFARAFITSYEGGSSRAARLVVQYR